MRSLVGKLIKKIGTDIANVVSKLLQKLGFSKEAADNAGFFMVFVFLIGVTLLLLSASGNF